MFFHMVSLVYGENFRQQNFLPPLSVGVVLEVITKRSVFLEKSCTN